MRLHRWLHASVWFAHTFEIPIAGPLTQSFSSSTRPDQIVCLTTSLRLFEIRTDSNFSRMQVMSTRQNMLRTMIQFASRDGTLCLTQLLGGVARVLTSIAGMPSLWWGISASILRQSTYSTARFGLYGYFSGKVRERSGTTQLSSWTEIIYAGAAGGLAGLIGNPTEVCILCC